MAVCAGADLDLLCREGMCSKPRMQPISTFMAKGGDSDREEDEVLCRLAAIGNTSINLFASENG